MASNSACLSSIAAWTSFNLSLTSSVSFTVAALPDAWPIFAVDHPLRICNNAKALGDCVVKKVFTFFGAPSGTPLGPLEQQVLEALWSRGTATVREVLEDQRITQAYTTVMTTLDRLYKKRLLDRIAEGRAFRYSPRQTPEELRRVAAVEGIRQLLGSGDASSLPLSYLVEALSTHDTQLLDELQLLVERKRRELKKAEQE